MRSSAPWILVGLAACHYGGSVPIAYGNHGWSVGIEGEGGVNIGRAAVGYVFGGRGFTYGQVGVKAPTGAPGDKGEAAENQGVVGGPLAIRVGIGGGSSGDGEGGIAFESSLVPTAAFGESCTPGSSGWTTLSVAIGLRILGDRVDFVVAPGVERWAGFCAGH